MLPLLFLFPVLLPGLALILALVLFCYFFFVALVVAAVVVAVVVVTAVVTAVVTGWRFVLSSFLVLFLVFALHSYACLWRRSRSWCFYCHYRHYAAARYCFHSCRVLIFEHLLWLSCHLLCLFV